MIPVALKRKIMVAATGGALAIAGVLVSHFEPGKVRGKPYIDPVGVLTVCDGQTGSDIDRRRIYTDAECDAWRDADLAIADAAVRRLISAPLNDWQRAALIDSPTTWVPGTWPTPPCAVSSTRAITRAAVPNWTAG